MAVCPLIYLPTHNLEIRPSHLVSQERIMNFQMKLWAMAAGTATLVSAAALAQQDDAVPLRSTTTA